MRVVATDEQTAWRDLALASFFGQLRAMLGWTPDRLAGHLGTSPAVIGALEHGEMRALPPWPETERILSAYGALVGMDLAPAGRRIRQQMMAGDHVVGPPPAMLARQPAAERRNIPPAGHDAGRLPAKERGPAAYTAALHRLAGAAASVAEAIGRQRVTITAVLRSRRAAVSAAGLAALLVLVTAVSIGVSRHSVEASTGPGSIFGARIDGWLGRQAARRDADGMTWIEVGDPRSRKADRLADAPR